MTQNQIQVACLSETFLKPEQRLHTHPDYKIHRLDRPDNRGGGVAIVIRKSLSSKLLPDLNLQLIESIGVEIYINDQSKLHVYSIYLPGSSSSTSIRQNFISDLRKIIQAHSNTPYYICGDFNSKHRHWNCSRANLAGTLLYEEYLDRSFVIAHPPEHTYFPEDTNRSPSTIDFMITNALHPYTDLTTEYLGSDHNAVLFEIELSSPTHRNNCRLTRAYNKANWDRYSTQINYKRR